MRPELAQAVTLLRSNAPGEIEKGIELLQNTVFSFSMKVCGHREDAEDTMQEVLYRSLRHLAQMEDPSAVAVWLYTVTRNRCWRMRRKSTRGGAQVSIDELMPSEPELERLLRDSAPDPEKHALTREEQRILQQAVLQLPPQLRIVLVLHDMEELDTVELAQILDLQPGTVRVRLHRARLLLRREFRQLTKTARKERQQSPRASARVKRSDGKAPGNHRPGQCRDLFRDLSDYLDGQIEAPACDQMQQHIDACPNCVAFIRDLRRTIDRCRSLKIPCSSSAARRLRNMLTREYLRLLELADREKAEKKL